MTTAHFGVGVHAVKGRAEAYGRRSDKETSREAPAVRIDHTHEQSEQEKKEVEKGTPIMVLKCEKPKTTTAKVAPSKGGDVHAVESVRKALEQFGRKRVIFKSENEPAILVLEGGREERKGDRDRVGGSAGE